MSGAQHFTLVEETGSTNADLAGALRSGDQPTEGVWHVARRQTAGKGRQGRDWHDGSGNFMGSTTVAIQDGDPPPASLSFVAALAVGQAIDEALDGACRPKLKWPNDVLLDGGKVSGILLEMVGTNVVVGVGVNLDNAPSFSDRKTASLKDHGTAPSVEAFAEILASVFARYLAAWRTDGLIPILKGFVFNSLHYTGSPITVHDTDGSTITGEFFGLDNTDGALRITLADGSERTIRAGDIS
ncbi:biotin--[acetyl-CoA-carboxylase] ligase [Erythrobacter sp. Alg231-14]|uniref:biotin--[acetyl-CoA-carboxylase] ligase n=1 Tax=Erythrobacter sp. Alg231-14 TaxID=1922225 RepID=UPI00307C1149